eukprot:TRINITY_DN727_c0_g1_i3.p1 TRINITY_DN727_c0_g1~~TRINITY_DN727_c0_g1_i3.p1  ORF type:complete len:350 (-),score=128.87 TRINITY_DN727_c0_g1_i3:526-1530(-)
MSIFNSVLPLSVLTDSYKVTHHAVYPEGVQKMVAYGEARQAWQKDATDQRFVTWGIRWFCDNYLFKKWTKKDVERADLFYAQHNTMSDGSFGPYPYPKELFLKFIEENDGYFPVKFQALRDGQAAHIHVPLYQITAEKEYATLCTFLETLLTHLWYATNVATLSRRTRDSIEAAFAKSVDDEFSFLIESRLHDFGFRGATGAEAATIGGMGHLLSFRGSDTMAAAYYAQFELNDGRPVAQSIPATEHSVMTSWPSEEAAIRNMIKHFGNGFFACVLDSYDYENCLTKILPKIRGGAARPAQGRGGVGRDGQQEGLQGAQRRRCHSGRRHDGRLD